MDPKGGALGITNPCTASSPRGLGRSSSGRREAGGAWQGAMGRQRAPPAPCWRRLLRAACRGLLSLCGTALRGLRGLWSLTWVLLICYKSWWDGAFQVTEELGTALQLRLEGSEEEEDGDSDSALEPGQTVAGQQQRRDASEAVLGRLEALEADVRFLCTELGAEKLLWSSRFLELLREQQSLRQRLQELPWQWNGGDSPEPLGEADDQSASGSEGEGLEGRRWMEPPRPPRGFIQPDRQKTQIHRLRQLLPHMSQPWASSLRQWSRATGSPGTAEGPSLLRTAQPRMLSHDSTSPAGRRAEGLPGAQAWPSTGGCILPWAPVFNTGSCFPSLVSAWSFPGRARTAAPVPCNRPQLFGEGDRTSSC